MGITSKLSYTCNKEVMMLSPSYDFKEFYRAVNNKKYEDVLSVTIEEATEAERNLFKIPSTDYNDRVREKAYVESLKRLICYMKCSIKPIKSKDPNFHLFKSIWQSF